MTENIFPPPAPPKSIGRKLGLGAALIAVPLGTAFLYSRLQESAQRHDRAAEEGAAYDVNVLRHVDPALIKYHELGRIETGMLAPRAIVTDAQGRLLVAGDRMVRIFTRTGQRLSDVVLSDTPGALAAAPDGTLYLGFKDHVEVYGADGHRKSVWASLGTGSHLTCIALSGDNVYLADAGRRIVERRSLEGKLIGEIGKADPARNIRGLIVPSPHLDVAVGANNTIWVSNPGRHSLESYNPEGELQTFWGKLGVTIDAFYGCCNPSDFALLSDGRIVTAEKGVARVKVYMPDGRLDAVVASPDSFGTNVTGLDLTVDPENHILVLEPGLSSIRVFARNEEGVHG